VDEAIDVIGEELRRLQEEPVGDVELQAAQGFIEGRAFLREERNLPQAHRLSAQELLGVPQSLEQYVRRAKRVTAEQIQEAARKFLDPSRATIVVVSP
jgi:predicted Zn-dependent peptidase